MQNRYAKVHILFRVLADKLEMVNPTKSADKNKRDWLWTSRNKVKAYWKNFFGVSSLTDMDDEQLVDLEIMLKKRIESISNSKKLESKL